MTFSERVLSLTQDKLVPKVLDNIINSSCLTARFLGNAKPWSVESLKRAIKYTTSGLGGSFSGLDTFSTSTSETTLRMTYVIRAYEQPVVIPGITGCNPWDRAGCQRCCGNAGCRSCPL